MLFSLAQVAALLLAAAELPAAHAQFYKIGSRSEILQSARTLAYDMMLFYQGNKSGEVPGILPGPPTENKGDYYWWEGGAMMGTYIDYWHLTGDTSYNHVVTQGMLHQVGPDRDYQPPNHTASLGNDDQGFWGMSAMLAAETKFPNPPDTEPQWLALAQAVFNTQTGEERHDETCNGGLRWQIPPTNAGYNYKNTIANACFFNLGSRLARYTANETYARWATETFEWLWNVKYIDHQTWKVYDGGHVEHNCTDINKAQFSYNAALLLHGSAFMYNYTNGSTTWRNRVEKLTEAMLRDFFPNNTAFEMPCEGRKGACTADMLTFKGYVHRWLSVVTQIAPFTRAAILPVLADSAAAAVRQCTGGDTGRRCGFYWSGGVFVDPAVDKTSGAGEQMNVLAAVSSLLIEEADPPATNKTGGISRGDPDAGNGRKSKLQNMITTGDKAGAAILTMVILTSAMGMWGWMSYD
ncbi:mannan endo-1,6-alpha-mannosidase [Phialemonium atrogriseum]|uniref:Mannan endo-1,6-alpha-mannosidase n=1 Tax=Phialemonium atrogriseum TaxID=1093897 RepID=A0AAJ0FF37_9PEZI|nr:mannan endo-1,6-alpha-mannosidase [Phialemonium atrogriseum]KAK1765042.1 mannan endo-1,6-alpha-mannosidase [Phialemonium atrogriseum]